jgi:hypothetical protein
LQAGDLFELELVTHGYGYIQYLRPGWHAPLIRAFGAIFKSPAASDQLDQLVLSEPLFVIQAPLEQIASSDSARFVGNRSLVESEQRMPPIRILVVRSAEDPEGWRVKMAEGYSVTGIEFGSRYPDIDQASLPIWDIPSHGLLLRMIETGWNLNRVGNGRLNIAPLPGRPQRPPELKGSPVTKFFSYFQDRSAADSGVPRSGGF